MSTKVRQVSHRTLPLPKGVHPLRVNLQYLAVICLIHVLCLLALDPWFFSWVGVASLVAGYFLFGLLGMSVGYHRLLCHRSFECPKGLEYFLAFWGACCVQESPIWWVAVHRRHHLHADTPEDPHSPLTSKFWSHMGWLLLVNRDHLHKATYHRYARDLACQRYYQWTDNRLVLD